MPPAAFQSVADRPVRSPESFRGGCSFGAGPVERSGLSRRSCRHRPSRTAVAGARRCPDSRSIGGAAGESIAVGQALLCFRALVEADIDDEVAVVGPGGHHHLVENLVVVRAEGRRGEADRYLEELRVERRSSAELLGHRDPERKSYVRRRSFRSGNDSPGDPDLDGQDITHHRAFPSGLADRGEIADIGCLVLVAALIHRHRRGTGADLDRRAII